MRYSSIFHAVSELSGKAGVTCVLIGGFAINYYKVSRQTLDVDFLITKDDLNKIADQLKAAGLELDFIQEVSARFKGSGDYLMDLDFVFVDKETLDKIVKDGKEIVITKHKFIVPSLNTLIALKLHAIKHNRKAREFKDLPDIINLIRANNVDCKSNDFRDLCLKYGTEELYNKIVTSA